MEINIKLQIIFVFALLATMGVLIIDPVSQNPDYHNFVDQRIILKIPNFWNVISNIPFLIVGAMGMTLLALGKAPGGLSEIRLIYFIFFVGVFLTGAGSAYYHYNPINQTLVWDRLPMAISFMAFFSAIWGEHISSKIGLKLVWPLIVAGIFSVAYWHFSEAKGNGDLRLYALVQFLPMLLIPLILLLFKSKLTGVAYIWGVIGAYFVAKIAEMFDSRIYHILGTLSGHSIKHLVAALGTFIFYLALCRRKMA